MRRKVMPTALVLLALMLDTAVIPFLISTPYIVSLTFATVLVLGVYLGRMHGMLYGMIGGLLTDILVGYPLGFNTFIFIGLGFLAGTIAYEPPAVRLRKAPSKVYLRRALTFMGMALAREVAIYGYQYFNTALLSACTFSTYSPARCFPRGCACFWARWKRASCWASPCATSAHPQSGR